MFKLTDTITKQYEGMLLREYMLEKLRISRTLLTDIKFNGGRIEVNGEQATVRTKLRSGDQLAITFPPEERSEGMVAEPIPLSIVYEDPHLLVIDKPANLPSIPSREHPSGTLANAVLYHYDTLGLQTTVHVVNRLDRNTSGLLIIAKHRYVHHLFSMMQRKGEIDRRYVAIVHGVMKEEDGVIDAPIGRKSDSIIEREVRLDGQAAVTRFTVLDQKSDKTLVKIKLETGRTHQIRVHMSYIGHPLLGDDLYGGSTVEIKRQALHSHELSFTHPITEEQLVFVSHLPEDMKWE